MTNTRHLKTHIIKITLLYFIDIYFLNVNQPQGAKMSSLVSHSKICESDTFFSH